MRLPKECRFGGTDVHIKRTRSGVLLIQKKTTPGQVEAPGCAYGVAQAVFSIP